MTNADLFQVLTEINRCPAEFAVYTASILWNDEHISKNMLACHLDEDGVLASRPQKFIQRSAGWISDRFCLTNGKRVADFGCGPGLYASRFATTGAAVTGIDFSARSIAFARGAAKERGLEIEYVESDYLEYQTDQKFDLITLIYCDLCALSPDQRRILLHKFRDSLADDGAMILDASSLNAYQNIQETTEFGRRTMGGFWSAEDYWGFKNTFKYDKTKVVLDKYVIVEPSRTMEVYNWLQYFSLESLTRELQECGLRVVEQYADVAGSPFSGSEDVFAIVAVKA